MFDLTGKFALVTGASGSIGASVAKALRDRGAKVALSGTRPEALAATNALIGGDAPILPCDLGDPAAVDALPGQAEAALGGLDILVSNAGLTRDGLLMRMKDDDWDRVIAVNLSAYFRLARAVMKPMMKRRFGRIIGIASVVGVTGNGGQANYAASKAGMIGFSKSLAQEIASRGITVNCIAPGFVVSPMTDALTDDQKSTMMSRIPVGRFGAPEDIAAAAVYLSSTEAGYVTGTTMHVNGGMAMI